MNYFNPDLQLQNTESVVSIKLKDLSSDFKGFKCGTTSVVEFKKEKVMMKQNMAHYFSSKAETIINESNVLIKSIYSTVISNIQSLENGLDD